jgi:hypothetical protein
VTYFHAPATGREIPIERSFIKHLRLSARATIAGPEQVTEQVASRSKQAREQVARLPTNRR